MLSINYGYYCYNNIVLLVIIIICTILSLNKYIYYSLAIKNNYNYCYNKNDCNYHYITDSNFLDQLYFIWLSQKIIIKNYN